jgi:hypothetical protein
MSVTIRDKGAVMMQTIGYYIASAAASAYALFLLGTHWAT